MTAWMKRLRSSELREMPFIDLLSRQNWTSFLKARKSKRLCSSETAIVRPSSHGLVSSSILRISSTISSPCTAACAARGRVIHLRCVSAQPRATSPLCIWARIWVRVSAGRLGLHLEGLCHLHAELPLDQTRRRETHGEVERPGGGVEARHAAAQAPQLVDVQRRRVGARRRLDAQGVPHLWRDAVRREGGEVREEVEPTARVAGVCRRRVVDRSLERERWRASRTAPPAQ